MVKVLPRKSSSSILPQEEDVVLHKLATNSKEHEVERNAAKNNLPYIDLAVFPVDGDHVRSFDEATARAEHAVLFQKERGIYRFGIITPDEALKERLTLLATEHDQKALFYLISEASLERALTEYLKKPFIEHLDQLRVSLSAEDLSVFEKDFSDLLALKDSIKSLPTTRVLEIILAGANSLGASDIHIEPEEDGVRLRYRIDGLLEDIGHIPSDVYHLTLSRVKMLTKMKLNTKDRSQDGSFFIMKENVRIDIRVSIIPSNKGETINMRLLNNAEANVAIETLGLRGSALLEIRRQIAKPHGMIVNTGPTGSGKTTTLYSLIREINEPS
ncbi:MAG: ATPase, T2SS/T4P/T4SS family, partial [Patescibacteria group bacterium]